jgi:cyclophilin family peptidyl-prolyl cis-trans isomerase
VSATLVTTAGTLELKLFAEDAPLAVANFVTLARRGAYDGLLVYRVVPNYLFETGDPTNTGAGGPGYCLAVEPSHALRHSKPGLLTMMPAGTGAVGSRFAVTLAPAPQLDEQAIVFGEVISGLDVAKDITARKTKGSRPVDDVRLTKIEIAPDFKPAPPETAAELTRANGEATLVPPARRLFAALGGALGLGAVDVLSLDNVRSKCSEVQAFFTIHYARQKAPAKALVYGRVERGAFTVEQLQFGRRAKGATP